jgi:hypothetical protein
MNSAYSEIHKLIEQEYESLRERNPNEQDGRKLWNGAKFYIRTTLEADWLLFQSKFKLGAFNER